MESQYEYYLDMPNIFLRLLFIWLLSFNICSGVQACSAFFWVGKKMIFGRNLDWYHGEGYVIKNNRGQEKYAYATGKREVAHWVSKFGSITFNQIGKEFPYGGMNEKGLVVEQLWLHASTYKENRGKTISELEWIQYQLDNFQTVAEVLGYLDSLTIKPIKATVHYFVADRTGDAAAIDFLGGEIMVSRKNGKTMVLTNTNYVASESYYQSNNNLDTLSRLSEDRYCQVSENLRRNNPEDIETAFKVLAASAENTQHYKTFWTVVYDMNNLEVRFRSFSNENIKTLSFRDLDFSMGTEILASDVNSSVVMMQSYSYAANKSLLTYAAKAMNIRLDMDLAAMHQYSPSSKRVDTVYYNYYSTLKITFKVRRSRGNLYYTVASGEKNFNNRRGVVSHMLSIDSVIVYTEVYAIPKGEYAVAAFHDLNGNKRFDTGMFGIPKEPYAFSKNKKGVFGLPAGYEKVKFTLVADTSLMIRL